MDTKPLLFGLIGFFIGGLLVSVAATTFDKPVPAGHMSDALHSGTTASMNTMRDNLAGKTGDDFDRSYIRQMMEHHQGAIDMARQAASQAKHDEIKQLSKDIIDNQTIEIDQMRQWQKAWGY